ncbi:phosphate system positive regulatory protein pho81 [Geranomyces michiganensis]|nr:phosphate system positive regulatory protein pho81 [Geranomyces michiganensis]
MKFGKYIQSQQVEWAGPQYLNYKGLKKIINSLNHPPVLVVVPPATTTTTSVASASSASAAAHGDDNKHYKELQALKTAFFFKLERELEKVNTFYLQKEADLKVRLMSLLEKRKSLQNRQQRATHASLITLREGFLQFRHDLTKLQNYVEVNATGFRKILKKWDKRSKSSTKELYLSRQIEIQPCFNNDVLAELTDQGTANLAEIEHLLSEEDPESSASGVDHHQHHHHNMASPPSSNAGEAAATLINESALTNALKQKNASAVQTFVSLMLRNNRPDGAANATGGATTATTSNNEEREFLCKSFLRFCADTSVECLEILLASGEVDCNYTDDISGRMCLHELAIADRLDMIQPCIEHHANVEATDVYGRTPLHYASTRGSSQSAVVLLKAGAKVNALDNDGCTPLVYSITGGHTDCVRTLIESGGAVVESHSPTVPIPLCLACEHGHKDIVMLLLSRGAQLVQNAEGLFPLHLTSREGHAQVSKLLIAHGADVNAADGFNGWAPIFYAASEGHLECVEVLLAAGCETELVDEFDWSPETYALYRGHIEIADLLRATRVQNAAAVGAAAAHEEMTISGGPASSGIKPMAPSGLFFEQSVEDPMDTDAGNMDLDELPDLSLPPPIIPFRIYGHAFLDQRFYVYVAFKASQLVGTSNTRPVTLLGSQQTSSLKLVVSTKPEVGVPYSVILPLQDDSEVYSFLVDDLDTFGLQLDVYPTFGTKPIGRGAVLASQISMTMRKSWSGGGDVEQVICPLFDSHLRVVGEVQFGFGVVKPFQHSSLQIGGKVDTYWKSTKVVGGSKAEGVHSFVTASSLAEEYIQVVVQLTRDGVPVIYTDWFLNYYGRLPVSLANLTFAQAREVFELQQHQQQQQQSQPPSPSVSVSMGGTLLHPLSPPAAPPPPRLSSPHQLAHGLAAGAPTSDLAKSVAESFLSLQELLLALPASVGVSIVIKYPTAAEQSALRLSNLLDVNTTVDAVLKTVYDQASNRSIIFMSFNPAVCTAVNWKQPNYGVFFGTRAGFDRRDEQQQQQQQQREQQQQQQHQMDSAAERDPRCTSIKRAIRFAKASNLLGVVCEAAPLVQAPILIKTIKASGLLLATCGDANNLPENVRVQDTNGVDAVIVNGVFRYNVT